MPDQFGNPTEEEMQLMGGTGIGGANIDPNGPDPYAYQADQAAKNAQIAGNQEWAKNNPGPEASVLGSGLPLLTPPTSTPPSGNGININVTYPTGGPESSVLGSAGDVWSKRPWTITDPLSDTFLKAEAAKKASGQGDGLTQDEVDRIRASKTPSANDGPYTGLPQFNETSGYIANPYVEGSWNWVQRQIEIDRRKHQGGGGGGGYGGAGASGTTTPGTTPGTTDTPPVGYPDIGPFPANSDTLTFNENDFVNFPEQYLPYIRQLMQYAGYAPTGFYGQYGAKEYKALNPGSPRRVSDDQINATTDNPNARAWLSYLFYNKGLKDSQASRPQ